MPGKPQPVDVLAHNRRAWDRESSAGSAWSTPVTAEVIAGARAGDWSIVLTPNRAVPRAWLGDVRGKRVLCLASGGGQQAPVLAAAGAEVVSLDNSAEQLAKDRLVAERDGLDLLTVQGDMANLSPLADQSFDLVINAVSTVFVADVQRVWNECFRVLRPGGALLSGLVNPMFFLFDHEEASHTGVLAVRHALPYSDLHSLEPRVLRRLMRRGEALQFGHTLEQLIGGQTDAGFVITGLLEDSWSDEATPLNRHARVCLLTCARRPPDAAAPPPGRAEA